MHRTGGRWYNTDVKIIEIQRNEAGQRLDRFLRKYLADASISHIYKMIRKDIKLNGKRAAAETRLQEGDRLFVYLPDETIASFLKVKQQNLPRRQFGIAYEDDAVLVAEKPRGLLTHGDRREKKNHLANQVLDYLIRSGSFRPSQSLTFRPAPVNRLDRNTTGLVLFGKTAEAMRELNALMREREAIEKMYLTIAAGELREDLHLKDVMQKDPRANRVRPPEYSAARASFTDTPLLRMETIVHPLRVADGFSLLAVHILTGKTHQIRAQLAKAGYPLIGDGKYGRSSVNELALRRWHLTTQLLHAYKLRFGACNGVLSTLSGKTVTASLPPLFSAVAKELFNWEEDATARDETIPAKPIE